MTPTPTLGDSAHDNTPHEDVNTLKPVDMDQAKSNRINEFVDTAAAEIQRLITQAALLHNQMSTAKTSTKKSYFKKKFDKVAAEVKQAAGILESLKAISNRPTEAEAE